MEILSGGRQNEQIIHNALKLYDYINSLPDNALIRCVKKRQYLLIMYRKRREGK